MNELVQNELKKIFDQRFSTSESTRANYARGEDTYDPVLSQAVVFPESNEEVSKILKLCNEHKIPVVPFGTGTSLEGNVLGNENGITISLEKMNKILNVNVSDFDCRVQANVTRKQLNEYLREDGVFFPIDPGADAALGGMSATSASGTMAVKYGTMRTVVSGLTVVLPTGDIVKLGTRTKKSSAGYNLTNLFIGSEGTLGIVTRAILKLSPEPRQQLTALLAIRDASGLVKLATKLRAEGGEFLSAMEFFSDVGLGIALENIPGLVFPLQGRASFYLLIEAGSGSMQVPLDQIISGVMEWGMDEGIVADGALAKSEAQRAVFWRLREEQPEGQRRLGAQLKHDLSVPPSQLGDFLDCANNLCSEVLKEVTINAFGHLGDGNVHYNLSPPLGQGDFSSLDHEFSIKLGRLATIMGGSFAAEHGLGRTKIVLADSLLIILFHFQDLFYYY